MKRPHVLILGAGPAGVAAAWQLRQRDLAEVTVLEQRNTVGGNAGSFELDGIPVDHGSHRLHPSCAPQIMQDLRVLLGGDLLDRPRHGRIRLHGQWIHFPIRPLDLIGLPWSFGLGIARDALTKLRTHDDGYGESFASVLERGLGRTICREFYFPYALKIWGLPPEQLSATQARRRVSAGSLQKMVRKVLNLMPGFKPPHAGRFFYPRHGYGQISERLADAARASGADIRLGTTVRGIRLGSPHGVTLASAGENGTIPADYVWSTIPVTALARLIDPPAPEDIRAAAADISFRAMILIYLVLAQSQFTPFDAHYFPEAEHQLTRLSEPKNYSGRAEPADRTVLCGELPCTVGDALWQASDDELSAIAQRSLERCGLPIRVPIVRVVTKRLPFAYPIYRRGYEEPLRRVDDWIASLDRVLTFGRQGLFAHDNTHHTLAMAYAAVDCLDAAGRFDHGRWRQHRAEFETHVVED
jgi:protoporphyrinogen oxidase